MDARALVGLGEEHKAQTSAGTPNHGHPSKVDIQRHAGQLLAIK